MLTDYFIPALIVFVLSVVFVYLLKKAALRDKKLVHNGIPLVGGIAFGISFILICLFSFTAQDIVSKEIIGIALSSLVMLIFGIIDDWKELSVQAKFVVQIIAASVLIFFGIRTYIVSIGIFWNIVITLIWILGIANAFNHLDVIDGLAGTAAVITSCAFVIISFLNNDPTVGLISVILLGAVSGFLVFNLPPARVYMGNAGSHLLGFILAAVALLISYAPLERKIALLTPLLILGLPIFDTAFLILVRLMKKMSPFKKSNDHPPLKLLALGYSKKKALLIMLAVGAFFSICGLLLSQVSNFSGLIILMIVIFSGLVIANRLIRIEVHG